MTRTRRRWFQLGLGPLFGVMALLAVFVAYHANWIRQRHEVLTRCDVAKYSWTEFDAPIKAPQLLWLFGEQGYADIWVRFESDHPRSTNGDEEAELRRVRALFPEAQRILPSVSPGMPPLPDPD
jgi:hypothetical protein